MTNYRTKWSKEWRQKIRSRANCSMGVIAMSMCLVGCGTISNLKSADGTARLDFSSYTKVIVRDFEDKATEKEKPAKQDEKRREMTVVCREFGDRLAADIEKKGVFQSVTRTGSEDESTLLVGGHVSQYEKGSAAARFWLGMGAGTSLFDAMVEFHQGSTGALLGTITVDKNSWALGGGIAASQTPEGFMQEAADKVANEVQKYKTTQGSKK